MPANIQNCPIRSVAESVPKTYSAKTALAEGGRVRNQALTNAVNKSDTTNALRGPARRVSLTLSGVMTNMPSATTTYTRAKSFGGNRARNSASRAVSSKV